MAFGPLTKDGALPLEYGTKPTTPLPGVEGANVIQLGVSVVFIAICYVIFALIVDPIIR